MRHSILAANDQISAVQQPLRLQAIKAALKIVLHCVR
jgi:hypothetical protein